MIPNFNPRSPHGERLISNRYKPQTLDFNPRSPHGERPLEKIGTKPAESFQSTLPARGATRKFAGVQFQPADFNPRSPHGERLDASHSSMRRFRFQSTLPARGATTAARGGGGFRRISIHAPRTGSDASLQGYNFNRRDFNPRSPHGERPDSCHPGVSPARRFQSTLPARGATGCASGRRRLCRISIHAPRTGSDPADGRSAHVKDRISIHAPRTGSDDDQTEMRSLIQTFQSTLPARGATGADGRPVRHDGISIHAPRTGSDLAARKSRTRPLAFQSTLPARGATHLQPSPCPHPRHFNPRSPHGERHSPQSQINLTYNFNPRSPHGERPLVERLKIRLNQISIHAPRTGSDRLGAHPEGGGRHFNPRSPHGERRNTYNLYYAECPISIHAPRTGSDSRLYCTPPSTSFQSTLPARGATSV